MLTTKRQVERERGINIHRGRGLKDSLRLADRLGISSRYRHGTGEIRLELPGHKSVLVNSRLKDLPRAALVVLKRASEQR